jgi:hypothetical protein
VRIAGILDQRIQIALHGGGDGDPVLVPEDGVPLDGQQPTTERPPGVPDLGAIALGPEDVPAGFLCDEGRYTRTQPPRTFRRSFCPQGATVGHTRLVSLSSQVSVFESEVAAETSLTLTARMMTSADGAKSYAANFAATSGLVATDVRRRQVKLPGGGGVGVLTSFRTEAGRLAGFSALAQRGRGLATLDAIGLADGFDHHDLLPLLQTVERRLGQLE